MAAEHAEAERSTAASLCDRQSRLPIVVCRGYHRATSIWGDLTPRIAVRNGCHRATSIQGDPTPPFATEETKVRNISKLAVLLLAGSILGTACVSSGTFEAKEAELSTALKEKDALKQENDKLQAQVDDLNKKIADLKKQMEQIKAYGKGKADEAGALAAGMENLQKRLDELEKQKKIAEERAAMFRSLADKLRSMVDAGQIKVTVRNGRMLLVLPNDILFDSGKTDLKPEGKDAIAKVAKVLATMDRHFLVAGHTDNLAINTRRFRSNWELSTARAVEVVRLLIDNGMKPNQLGAAGYAEYDPAASNSTPEGQAQNRRIEIVVEPNLSELPSLEGIVTSKK
jgi:chemotaxis protein MotB